MVIFLLVKTLKNSIDVQSIFLTLIPIGGTILVTLIGYLINKKMDINRENNSRKRLIYEEFLNAITLTKFGNNLELLIIPGVIDPFKDVHTAKLDVIQGYERIKLWGSKGVVEACYGFFDAQIEYTKNPEKLSQDEMKKSYHQIIEQMRKDLKMDSFLINKNNVHNVTFDRDDFLQGGGSQNINK